MAKKTQEKPEEKVIEKPKAEKTEKVEKPKAQMTLRLTVGVNFVALGDTEETRLEAGLIEAGILPPAFEQLLRERKLLLTVNG